MRPSSQVLQRLIRKLLRLHATPADDLFSRSSVPTINLLFGCCRTTLLQASGALGLASVCHTISERTDSFAAVILPILNDSDAIPSKSSPGRSRECRIMHFAVARQPEQGWRAPGNSDMYQPPPSRSSHERRKKEEKALAAVRERESLCDNNKGMRVWPPHSESRAYSSVQKPRESWRAFSSVPHQKLI